LKIGRQITHQPVRLNPYDRRLLGVGGAGIVENSAEGAHDGDPARVVLGEVADGGGDRFGRAESESQLVAEGKGLKNAGQAKPIEGLGDIALRVSDLRRELTCRHRGGGVCQESPHDLCARTDAQHGSQPEGNQRRPPEIIDS